KRQLVCRGNNDFMRKCLNCKLNVRIVLIAVVETILLTSVASLSTKAQDAFDLVSIKQVNPDLHPGYSGPSECGGSYNLDPQVFSTSGVTVYTLIGWAYGNRGLTTMDCLTLNKFNIISGGPPWIRSERFDIHALLPDRSVRYTDKQL